MSGAPNGRFTGRHITAILVAFFGVVIAVNVLMARLATSTFGGVTVENSYVASQHFNRWLDEADAERALGWKASALRAPDGRLAVQLTGVPAGPVTLTAVARHPLGRLPDQALQFADTGGGHFLSTAPLPEGRWTLRIEVQAGGRQWRTESEMQ